MKRKELEERQWNKKKIDRMEVEYMKRKKSETKENNEKEEE